MWHYESEDDIGEDLGDGAKEVDLDEEAAGELEGDEEEGKKEPVKKKQKDEDEWH